MRRSRQRRVRPATERLEDRRLLAGGLTGQWVGQDGHDYAGGPAADQGNGYQDIRLNLAGIPAGRTVTTVDVLPYGGGEWNYNLGPYSTFTASVKRAAGATTADIYVEPYQVETGREFHVVLRYDDGSSDSTNIPGGAADPNLRMPGVGVAASWLGQDGSDYTSLGPAVGPDGMVDAHLRLTSLDPARSVTLVTLTRATGTGWGSGLNPAALNNAQFVPGAAGSNSGELYFTPDTDLFGQPLTATVAYSDGKTDRVTLTAGHTSTSQPLSAPSPVSVTWNNFSATWVGQDGLNLVGPGDVHLAVSGLPAGRTVQSAMLSDQVGFSWFYARPGSGQTSSDPNSLALGFRQGSDTTRADLGFPPVRDELGATLTLRLTLDDGSQWAVRVDGDSCDPGLRAADIASTRVVAHPGDDLNDLANHYGTVRLVSGVYPMSQPLVLNRPVTLQADPGVVLLFSQAPTAPTWTAAIKVNASHTTLNGFAVRFAGPVRWTDGVSYGPAVVGTTDNFDPWNPDPRLDLTFTNLDLQAPPASTPWEEAPRLLRLASAESGRIADNHLKGGITELLNGPWLVTGNTYLGAMPNTYAYAVFAAHYTHDLTVSDNTITPTAGSGKTWRFLVLTQSGHNDTVLDNTVVGVGPMDTDTVPNPNAPETILTEAYRLHYEGQVASVSPDGWVVQTYALQGDSVRPGDVLSILSGPQAGQWRQVAQVIGPNTFLLDGAITPGKFAVSLATGFVRETFQGNTIDARGSSTADPLVLVGNHFGLTVSGNHILGGNHAFRITAAPTEAPDQWGWSHAPMLGLTMTGNTVDGSLRGGFLDVERSSYVKSGAGRVYFTGTFRYNTGFWDAAALARRTAAGLTGQPTLVTVGNDLTTDPGELVLASSGNLVSGPLSVVTGPTFLVRAATFNGVATRSQGIVLPTLAPPPPPASGAPATSSSESTSAPSTTTNPAPAVPPTLDARSVSPAGTVTTTPTPPPVAAPPAAATLAVPPALGSVPAGPRGVTPPATRRTPVPTTGAASGTRTGHAAAGGAGAWWKTRATKAAGWWRAAATRVVRAGGGAWAAWRVRQGGAG